MKIYVVEQIRPLSTIRYESWLDGDHIALFLTRFAADDYAATRKGCRVLECAPLQLIERFQIALDYGVDRYLLCLKCPDKLSEENWAPLLNSRIAFENTCKFFASACEAPISTPVISNENNEGVCLSSTNGSRQGQWMLLYIR